jgi:hypothetical protein
MLLPSIRRLGFADIDEETLGQLAHHGERSMSSESAHHGLYSGRAGSHG